MVKICLVYWYKEMRLSEVYGNEIKRFYYLNNSISQAHLWPFPTYTCLCQNAQMKENSTLGNTDGQNEGNHITDGKAQEVRVRVLKKKIIGSQSRWTLDRTWESKERNKVSVYDSCYKSALRASWHSTWKRRQRSEATRRWNLESAHYLWHFCASSQNIK